MRKILDFLVHSNIYLSLGASVVAWATIFLLGFPSELAVLFLPFAGGMFIYNLNRHTDKAEDVINVPKRMSFIRRHGIFFMALGTILYLAALFIAFSRNIPTLFAVLLPGMIGIVYSLFRLKRIFIFKNVMVAIAWGITPILVGLYFNSATLPVFVLFLMFSLGFFINTAIFDIKDTMGDHSSRIKTLPIRMGVKNTRKICFIINTINLGILLLSILAAILPVKSLLLAGFLAYIYLYIYYADKDRGSMFYGIVVDGEFVFLFFLVLVLSLIS